MKRFAPMLAAAAAMLTTTTATLAHDGHSPAASHWHATDTAGFALVAVLAGLAIWFSRNH